MNISETQADTIFDCANVLGYRLRHQHGHHELRDKLAGAWLVHHWCIEFRTMDLSGVLIENSGTLI